MIDVLKKWRWDQPTAIGVGPTSYIKDLIQSKNNKLKMSSYAQLKLSPILEIITGLQHIFFLKEINNFITIFI